MEHPYVIRRWPEVLVVTVMAFIAIHYLYVSNPASAGSQVVLNPVVREAVPVVPAPPDVLVDLSDATQSVFGGNGPVR